MGGRDEESKRKSGREREKDGGRERSRERETQPRLSLPSSHQ